MAEPMPLTGAIRRSAGGMDPGKFQIAIYKY